MFWYIMNAFFLCCLFQEAGILSPVNDGDVKPQIDSNKANNYNIVKEVGQFTSLCHPNIINDSIHLSSSPSPFQHHTKLSSHTDKGNV